MNLTVLASFGLSLILTILLEVVFFLLSGNRNKKDFWLVVLVNILTNPVVVLVYWLAVTYTNWSIPIVLIPLEISAVVVEGYYFKKYGTSFRYPYLFAVLVNIFSFGTGLILQLFI